MMWRHRILNRALRWGAVSLGISATAAIVGWNALVFWIERTGAAPIVAPEADHLTLGGWEDRAARSRQHLRQLREEGNIPGLAIAVADSGQIVWSETSGYADVEGRRPVRRNTRFRIQSLSKTLTASALMRLHEQGRIRLDQSIFADVPSYGDKGRAITAMQLASHRSGIRSYRDDSEALESRHCETANDAIAMFRDDPLVFPPGTDSIYSNFGYQLLGAQLEAAAGTSFPLLMRQHVFEPLGMSDTSEYRLGGSGPNDSEAYDFVTPYSRDGRRVRSPHIDFTCRWPSGGLLSSAEDMIRFAAAHSRKGRGHFLSRQGLELLFQPQTPPRSPIGIGMGWLVGRDWRLRRVVFNFGAGSGRRGFMVLYPDEDVAMVILANLGHARMDMERLCRIAMPFLRPSHAPWPEVSLLFSAACWFGLIFRRRIQARKIHRRI